VKVLFINNYREITGWANAGRNYILAMDEAGIEVVPRYVNMGGPIAEPVKRIVELEQRDDSGCDVVIQCVLPHLLEYSPHFKKNIALYFTETDSFATSPWAENINMMDEAWVCCEQNRTASLNSNVTVPIQVVPIPCNIEKYEHPYEPLPIPELKDKFVFYFIGEAIKRKNLPALLKAFHTEFDPSEPVALCIKTSLPGISPGQCGEVIQQLCLDIKKNLKLYPDVGAYHKEVVITSPMNEEDLMRLHAMCDCFVCPSYGEAGSIPAFDAMAMGKTPIVTDYTGMIDFVLDEIETGPDGEHDIVECGCVCFSREEPVFGMIETFDNLYTGRETWQSIHVGHLSEEMRRMYENADARQRCSDNGINAAYQYTYGQIGNQIKGLLDGI
jgi:glycosyltransferase involved in cell wall biosynthesis